MRRPWILGAIAVLVVVSGLFVADAAGWFSKTASRWVDVVEQPLVRRIPASGELRSADSVSLGCPGVKRMWNFTITQIADEGTRVAQGHPVLAFDGQQFRERQREWQNRLDQAHSTLEKTRLEEQHALEQLELQLAETVAEKAKLDQMLAVPEDIQKRLELDKLRLDGELVDAQVASLGKQIEVQRANRASRIASAEAEVGRLTREVEQVERDLQKFNVIAPRDGYVVHVKDWNGNKPKVGDGAFIGRRLMEVADLSHMQVEAEVAESDARYVVVGQEVEVRLDAAPDRAFPGRIVELGRLFHEKSPEVPKMVFDVVIELDETDESIMRPGMAARVEVLSPTDNPVVHIPESAVLSDSGGSFVRVRSAAGVETRAVEIGARWNGRVIVHAGLEAGEQVAPVADAVEVADAG